MQEKLIEHRKQNDEISVKELLFHVKTLVNYLASKWIIIICFGLFGALLGYGYASVKKPVYTASTTFVLEDAGGGSSSALGNLGGLASMAGIDLGGGGGGIFQGDNIFELYKSRTMIEKTLLSEVSHDGKSDFLINYYIEFNGLKKKDRNFEKINFKGANSASRLKDSIINVVVDDIRRNYLFVGKSDKKTSIIKVEIKSKDEYFAKSFNDLIVRNVNDFYVQTKTKKSMDNVDILQQKVDSVRRVMNGSIYSAAIAADQTPNLNPTRQVQRVAPIQRSQFSAETNKAILAEIVKNLEMSKIALRKETPLIQVIDNPVFPLEKTELGVVKGIIFGFFIFVVLMIFYQSVRLVLKNI